MALLLIGGDYINDNDYITEMYAKKTNTADRIEKETAEARSRAAEARGGHISKGLLHRAESGEKRYIEAIDDKLRYKVFLKLQKMSGERSKFAHDSKYFKEIDDILQLMNIVAYPIDGCDYVQAALDSLVYRKYIAISHFIKTYGNNHVRKILAVWLMDEGCGNEMLRKNPPQKGGKKVLVRIKIRVDGGD